MEVDRSPEPKIPEILAALDQADLAQFLLLVENVIGIPFPKDRWGDLARHLRDLTQAHAFAGPCQFVKWFLYNADPEKQIELLAKQLTIGETYFFRDEKNFLLLRNEILPKLLHSPKEPIILWSAGCSSGEEPYSMAMIADMTLLSTSKVQIVASDVNPNALDKARKGVYTDWSFRPPPAGVMERYFTKIDHNKFKIAPPIQQKVLFMQINLVAASYPPPLDKPASVDVIFCRNVLMYFTNEKRYEMLNKFCTLLVDGGWLIVSASESALIQHPSLYIDRSSEPNLFRKKGGTPPFQAMVLGNASPRPAPSIPVSAPKQVMEIVPKSDTKSTAKPDASRPPGSPTSSLEQEVWEQAKTLVNSKRVAEAVTLLTGYLETQEKWGIPDGQQKQKEAIALLAKLYADMGNLEQAEYWYRRAIATDRLQIDYYYYLAMILLEKKHSDEAMTLLEKALFLQQDFVVAHLQLAGLYQDRKRAQKHARNVLELLANTAPGAIVPFADGLTAETIRTMARQMMS